MPTRYKRNDIIINSSPFYAPLRRERGLKAVRQYGTIKMHQPTLLQRASLKQRFICGLMEIDYTNWLIPIMEILGIGGLSPGGMAMAPRQRFPRGYL